MKLNIGGLLVTALVILGVVYAYNRFVAEKGKSIANLGEPKA